ncbi:unnamed protein product [Calypogeia fissa]
MYVVKEIKCATTKELGALQANTEVTRGSNCFAEFTEKNAISMRKTGAWGEAWCEHGTALFGMPRNSVEKSKSQTSSQRAYLNLSIGARGGAKFRKLS